jgi:hypothetical protein
VRTDALQRARQGGLGRHTDSATRRRDAEGHAGTAYSLRVAGRGDVEPQLSNVLELSLGRRVVEGYVRALRGIAIASRDIACSCSRSSAVNARVYTEAGQSSTVRRWVDAGARRWRTKWTRDSEEEVETRLWAWLGRRGHSTRRRSRGRTTGGGCRACSSRRPSRASSRGGASALARATCALWSETRLRTGPVGPGREVSLRALPAGCVAFGRAAVPRGRPPREHRRKQ